MSRAGIVRPLTALESVLASATRDLGRQVRVDAVALTAQRAAFTGFARNGSRSVGGHAQMAATADGWVALSLPRPSDVAMLPALVGAAVEADDWSEIGRRLASMASERVVETATLLGMAVSAVGATAAPDRPWSVHCEGPARPRNGRAPTVIDLTSLWAGPLAGGLLAEAGCRVLKVESASRPDGARRGPAGFFDLLNRHKEHVSLALPGREALNRLRELISDADLVLEASRPRVMQQWGICPDDVVAAGTAWVSITGHGRRGPNRNRVAFGDDAAVSGGLVVSGYPPMFVGDAIADPIAGVAAASAAAQLLTDRRAALVDVSLAGAAAWVAGRAGRPGRELRGPRAFRAFGERVASSPPPCVGQSRVHPQPLLFLLTRPRARRRREPRAHRSAARPASREGSPLPRPGPVRGAAGGSILAGGRGIRERRGGRLS